MKIIDSRGIDLYDRNELIAEPTAMIFRSRLPNVGTEIQLVSGTAYFVYVGRTTQPIVPVAVEFYVSTPGAGSNSVEVGLFSTPEAPNKAGQSLTKLAAIGTADIDSLLSAGVKSNSNLAFGYSVPAGTYLWAGIHTASYSTQPRLAGLCQDYGEGLALSTSSAGVLTGSGPWAGSLIAPTPYWNSPIAPDLRLHWNVS